MQLSERLKQVADFVTKGNRLADIGTDHGYIPIELVERGTVPYAIAMDINEGPLLRASEHIKEKCLEDKIETRISDGLYALKKDEADSVVIAGMGGSLIVNILKNGKEILKDVKEIILSPHTEIFLVRKYLIDNGYKITDEAIVYDMGKYYTIIKAIHTEDSSYRKEYENNTYNYMYGKILLEEKSDVFVKYMKNELKKQRLIMENMKNASAIDNRREEVKQNIEYIEKFLEI